MIAIPSFSPESAFRAVIDWIEAVHAGDTEKLLALSFQDIELIGPRGTTSGYPALINWLNQANMQFLIQSLKISHRSESINGFQADSAVINVRHQAIWTRPDQQTSQAECLSIFTLAQRACTQPKIRAYEHHMLRMVK